MCPPLRSPGREAKLGRKSSQNTEYHNQRDSDEGRGCPHPPGHQPRKAAGPSLSSTSQDLTRSAPPQPDTQTTNLGCRAPRSSSSIHPVAPIHKNTAPARDKCGHVCLPRTAWAGMGWGWRRKGGSHAELGVCSSLIQILFLHWDVPHPDQPPPTHPPYTHIHTFMQVLNTRYGLTSSLPVGGGAWAGEGSPTARRKRWG